METGVRQIRLKITIEKQRAEEEVTTTMLVDEHRILADPAEPGSAGEVALEQWCSINDGAPARSGVLGLHPAEEFLQLLSEHAVVIQPARVASDLAGHGWKFPFPALRESGWGF